MLSWKSHHIILVQQLVICPGNKYTGRNSWKPLHQIKTGEEQQWLRDAYPLHSRLYSLVQDYLPALCWFQSPLLSAVSIAHWQPLRSPRHQSPLQNTHRQCDGYYLYICIYLNTMYKFAVYYRPLPICSSLWPTSGSPQYTTSPNAS